NTPIYLKVANINYTYRPSPTLSVEAGIKGTLSSFENEVEVNFQEDGVIKRDPETSDFAKLEETITAAFVSTEWKINEANQLNGGIRYEQTSTYLSTQGESAVVDRIYGYFFPSLLYSRTLTDRIGISMGYSKRITRPTFNDIAPFVFIVNPNTFFSGNPGLRPAITNGFKLDLRVSSAVFSFDYSHSKDEIANFQPEINPGSHIQTMSSKNLDYLKLYSLSFSFPWTITEWWDIQAFAGGYLRNLKTSHLVENKKLDLYSINLNLVNQIKLPKHFSMELAGSYDSKMVWGIWQFKPMGSLNFGVQKQLNKDMGTIRFFVDDIFHTSVWKMYTQIPESNLAFDFLY